MLPIDLKDYTQVYTDSSMDIFLKLREYNKEIAMYLRYLLLSVLITITYIIFAITNSPALADLLSDYGIYILVLVMLVFYFSGEEQIATIGAVIYFPFVIVDFFSLQDHIIGQIIQIMFLVGASYYFLRKWYDYRELKRDKSHRLASISFHLPEKLNKMHDSVQLAINRDNYWLKTYKKPRQFKTKKHHIYLFYRFYLDSDLKKRITDLRFSGSNLDMMLDNKQVHLNWEERYLVKDMIIILKNSSIIPFQ